MSVTKDGVKGYEYQYKVTVLILLSLVEEAPEVFVEAEGIEDAFIRIRTETEDKLIEVQVKREENPLDIAKLASWLTHFQERKADNNLLSRLIDDPNTIALFVTRSRCSDDTVCLRHKLRGDISVHQQVSIIRGFLEKFKSCLDSFPVKSNSAIAKQRAEFCKKQAGEIDNPKLKNVLKQVLIWEEIEDEQVDKEVCNQLHSDHQIPQSKTEDVYLNLLEMVRNGRDNGTDIYPSTINFVRRNRAGHPILDPNYHERTEQKELTKLLLKEPVLLLSGISQCGKSELAKQIASHFFYFGYNYLLTDSIQEVSRFYNSDVIDKKIVVLEDPFGHVRSTDDSQDFLKKIQSIIENLQAGNKLIITSRSEILYEVYSETRIEKCHVADIRWHDLTILDRDIVLEYWQRLSENENISADVIEIVRSKIQEVHERDLFQIGQLRYLAKSNFDEFLSISPDVVEQIARSHSKDIARAIKRENNEAAEMLSVLGFCSTTIKPVALTDLAFIFAGEDPKLSMLDDRPRIISLDGKEDSFPAYKKEYSLFESQERAIEYLEERQLIRLTDGALLFTHPNYFEASRHLFATNSGIKQNRILSMFESCLFCANPDTALLASKQLEFLYTKLPDSYHTRILGTAIDGLSSAFPSVRDHSLIFLVKNIEDLDPKKTKRVIRQLQYGGSSSSEIYWFQDAIPYISKNGRFFGSAYTSFFFKNDKENDFVQSVEEKLKRRDLITTYEAWHYVAYLKHAKPKNIDPVIQSMLLQQGEAFVRKRIVFVILNLTVPDFGSFFKFALDDEHPDVIFETIKAASLNWAKLSNECRIEILPLIEKVLHKRPIAIRMFTFIYNFELDLREENHPEYRQYTQDEKQALWFFWSRLFLKLSADLPLDLHINSGRFGLTMDKAMKYLDIETGLGVLTRWYDRIDYQIKNGETLDEFELAVADNLLMLTKEHYDKRKDLFSVLINHPETDFVLSNHKWIVKYWDILHDSEKAQIIDILRSDRIDLRWIKAVLLASEKPPKEVIDELLGDVDFSSDDYALIIQAFPDFMLQDCLKVYCGAPQPLWWLAVHHKNKTFWEGLKKYVLLNDNSEAFEICLYEFLGDGVNGTFDDWDEAFKIWEQVCDRGLDIDSLATNLLYFTAKCVCNLTSANKLWSILINRYIDLGNEQDIISIIIDHFELLQQTGSKGDVPKILGKDFFFDKVFPYLKDDNYIIQFTNTYAKSSDHVRSILDQDLKLDLILRCHFTFDILEGILEKFSFPDDIKEKIKGLPNNINIKGKDKLEALNEEYHYKLPDWFSYRDS